jgi:VCBS repeat-containing protein
LSGLALASCDHAITPDPPPGGNRIIIDPDYQPSSIIASASRLVEDSEIVAQLTARATARVDGRDRTQAVTDPVFALTTPDDDNDNELFYINADNELVFRGEGGSDPIARGQNGRKETGRSYVVEIMVTDSDGDTHMQTLTFAEGSLILYVPSASFFSPSQTYYSDHRDDNGDGILLEELDRSGPNAGRSLGELRVEGSTNSDKLVVLREDGRSEKLVLKTGGTNNNSEFQLLDDINHDDDGHLLFIGGDSGDFENGDFKLIEVDFVPLLLDRNDNNSPFIMRGVEIPEDNYLYEVDPDPNADDDEYHFQIDQKIEDIAMGDTVSVTLYRQWNDPTDAQVQAVEIQGQITGLDLTMASTTFHVWAVQATQANGGGWSLVTTMNGNPPTGYQGTPDALYNITTGANPATDVPTVADATDVTTDADGERRDLPEHQAAEYRYVMQTGGAIMREKIILSTETYIINLSDDDEDPTDIDITSTALLGNSVVVGGLSATDPDDTSFTFSLTDPAADNDNELFSIHVAGGLIFRNGRIAIAPENALIFEGDDRSDVSNTRGVNGRKGAGETYVVEIQVRGGGRGNTDTEEFTITITEASLYLDEDSHTSAGRRYTSYRDNDNDGLLAEDADGSTAPGIYLGVLGVADSTDTPTLAAHDSDPDTGNNNDHFMLNANDNRLYYTGNSADSGDFENGDTLTVDVEIKPSDTRIDTGTVTVPPDAMASAQGYYFSTRGPDGSLDVSYFRAGFNIADGTRHGASNGATDLTITYYHSTEPITITGKIPDLETTHTGNTIRVWAVFDDDSGEWEFASVTTGNSRPSGYDADDAVFLYTINEDSDPTNLGVTITSATRLAENSTFEANIEVQNVIMDLEIPEGHHLYEVTTVTDHHILVDRDIETITATDMVTLSLYRGATRKAVEIESMITGLDLSADGTQKIWAVLDGTDWDLRASATAPTGGTISTTTPPINIFDLVITDTATTQVITEGGVDDVTDIPDHRPAQYKYVNGTREEIVRVETYTIHLSDINVGPTILFNNNTSAATADIDENDTSSISVMFNIADTDVTNDPVSDLTVRAMATAHTDMTMLATPNYADTDSDNDVASEAISAEVSGTYGSFILTRTAQGAMTARYNLHENNEDVQELDPGDELFERLTVFVNDGDDTSQLTYTVTIKGENDAPTILFSDDADAVTTYIGKNSTTATDDVTFNIADVDDDDPVNMLIVRVEASSGTDEPASPDYDPTIGIEVVHPTTGMTTVTENGDYGMFTITRDANGEMTARYMLNPSNTAVQALQADENLYEKLTIFVNDGAETSMLTYTVAIGAIDITVNEEETFIANLSGYELTNPTVSGDDANDVRITQTQDGPVLEFISAPDFENPSDAGDGQGGDPDNIYEFTIDDGTTSFDVDVTIADVDML